MSLLAIPEPDDQILDRRAPIVEALRRIIPQADCVIADDDGRRAFETDALTAYKQMPLAVVLPTSTEQVSEVLKYCHENNIKVIASKDKG